MKKLHLCLFSLVLLAFSACRENKLKKVDVSNIPVKLDIQRFENDLFAEVADSTKIASLKKKYGRFYDLYCKYIISAGYPADPATAQYLREFYANVDIKSLYKDEQEQYASITDIQAGLEDALKHYKYYFPQRSIPQLYTFISGFNFNVVTDSTILGIGLDMYLGHDYKHYAGIGLPMYKVVRMQREYVVPDVMKGFVESEFPSDEFRAQNLLGHIITYNGKIWYLLDAFMPNVPDTLKTGYTAKQQKWCNDNEARIWGYFVEHKLFFLTNQDKYIRYITDGPTTNGMPKESPAMMAAWLGLQVVRAYMNQNPNVTIVQLMQNNDAQAILNQSKYKP